jgi:hypothetical protein
MTPGTVKNFLFFMFSNSALGPTQLHISWAPKALSQGVKRLGLEDDHSPQTSTEDKKMWIYICTLHTSSWCIVSLLKHMEKFTS